MIRHGLRLILESEPGISVVGEAGDGRDALEMVSRARPDVVLMDVRMPRLDGIEACRLIRDAASGELPYVLMLTTFDLEDYVYAALRAGASGFLLKDAPAEQLVAAVEEVARRRSPDPSAVPGLDRLTEREVEVLRLMACGMSNSEIAGQLYLGEATVKTHVGRVLGKLDARDRVQAVVAAYESGL